MQYSPAQIEAKWKSYWSENQTYKTDNHSGKPKYYVLDMFPYPSGAGLHVGHPLGYIASDIYARYKRLKGYNVLHPMGYDAFGLPAEQYAIQTGVHPAVSTAENINRYRSQLDNIGFSYDWDRSVNTSDPKYYKWTQWIFLQLYNHYYDLQQNKAIPVSQLIDLFHTSGNFSVKAAHSQDRYFTADEWNSFSDHEKELILMNYRLAYRKVSYVNWCEALGTVLANDEVKDGLSERGGHPVEKRPMMQWSLRITAYAERMLNDLDRLEWSDALKAMQRNWIGKSVGAQVFFDISNHSSKIEIFTTRPDTIFGATFMVLAPEHELVDSVTTPDMSESVKNYRDYVSSRSERDRMTEVKEVTGVFTGAYAIHPFTKKHIPVWIGEYVLKDYGTGAIMAVPSDDDRDFAFAEKFGLPVVDVVDKSEYPGAGRHEKSGRMINSAFLDGMEVNDAIKHMLDLIENNGIGSCKTNYKLRDANFSRQRYWGEPFPVLYGKDQLITIIEESNLPVTLPEVKNFHPTAEGKSPLASAVSWVHEISGFERETDTMPGFAGSSWYFLRYMDPDNETAFASQEALHYWKDVDLYVGGTEHAVGHLMYSRFWHKFLYDLGKLPTDEPFRKLINQGMIQGVIASLYLQKEKTNDKHVFVCAQLVSDSDSDEFIKISVYIDFVSDYGTPKAFLDKGAIAKFIQWRPEFANAIFKSSAGTYDTSIAEDATASEFRIYVQSEVGKMSKRYFNVVNPDDVVARYGADCFRMYEMFLGPVEQSKPWDTKGIEGVQKFLKKFWSLYTEEDAFRISNENPSREELKILHQTIKKITDDIERFSFNTAVSAFMVCVNDLKRLNCNKHDILEPLVRLLAPFAPFLTEELWSHFNNGESVHHAEFPVYNPQYLTADSIEYPLSVNGKKRDLITLDAGLSNAEIEKIVLENDQVQKWLSGQPPKKVIVVPGRMINIVV